MPIRPEARHPLCEGLTPSLPSAPPSVVLKRRTSTKKHPFVRDVPTYCVLGSLKSIRRESTLAGATGGNGGSADAGGGAPGGNVPGGNVQQVIWKTASWFHFPPPSIVLNRPKSPPA